MPSEHPRLDFDDGSITSLDAAIDARLRFEELIADLSSHFVNLPAGEVDREIEDAQRRVCEILDVDLSALWQWSHDEPNLFTLTHLFSPPGGPERPVQLDANDSFPWALAQLMSSDGSPIIYTTSKLPPEAARDIESRTFYGIRSSVLLPLSVGGGSLIGALSFDTIREERDWLPEIVQRLQIVSQVFTNALVRRNDDLALRASEERLSLATESAGAGVWELNAGTNAFWATDRARALFGFSADESISLQRFESLLHPDDLSAVQGAIGRGLDQGDPIDVEYRIMLGDGKTRWIYSLGRVHAGRSGEAVRILGVSIDITDRKQTESELKASLREVKRLKRSIQAERDYLRSEIKLVEDHNDVIGHSPAIQKTLKMVEQVAATDSVVLVSGETGTGKELIAHEIHRLSSRRKRLMVKVNCAALPTALVESELFGREKGAYTGALSKQVGRFELADKSTLFLDEVGDLPMEVQVKLLRVLQNGEIERLGNPRTIKVDVRVVAATNRDLVEEVRQGRFREDLYYRLSVFPLRVPPLRERIEDIPLLVWSFLAEFSSRMGKKITRIPSPVMARLQRNSWPGNVRELRNVIERGAILSTGNVLTLPDLGDESPSDAPLTLTDCERRHILSVLEQTAWRIKGPGGAAALLGLNASTLYSRMEKLEIPTARSRPRP